MAASIEIEPSGPIDARVRPPGSKSITNRALVCAALADGRSQLGGALDSDDTQVMIDALKKLGLAVAIRDAGQTIDVEGCGGTPPASRAELDVCGSGTTIRFLTALLATARGEFRLDGAPRMRERPMGDLLEALRALGGEVQSEPGGFPPIVVHARGLAGGAATLRGDTSSQFLSGLLMAAPRAAADVELTINGPLVSRPYVDMTLAVMERFGVSAARRGHEQFFVSAPQSYRACSYDIEPDASAASYFFAAAAITGGRATVEGLGRDSLQGDIRFCDVLQQMGCDVEVGRDRITVAAGPLKGVDVDMNAISDTVQTLAAVALFADGPTTIRNVAHIRHKETDRLGDLAGELRKLGADVRERVDGLEITPAALRPATIDTYDDHRMAMSFALVGLRQPGVVINDPQCAAKTYPGFFEDLARIRRS